MTAGYCWKQRRRHTSGEESELRAALPAVEAHAVVDPAGRPQGERQHVEDTEDLTPIRRTKPMDDRGKLDAADREAGKPMSALVNAVQDQVVYRQRLEIRRQPRQEATSLMTEAAV